MREASGVFVAVPTPYRGDAVATDRLQGNLERWNEMALTGYVVLGSTGEYSLLNEAERDAVLGAARDVVPREKIVIAGTGSDSTLLTIRQTRRAAELGADAALVTTPRDYPKAFAQPGTQIRHYLAVADASPIPILLCNSPGNTGINLGPDTVARIAEHANVCGIADASGDIPQDAQIIQLTPKSFHILVGSASALVPSLIVGASGGILALAAVAPREYVEIYALARQGRWEEAKEIAARMILADRGVLGKYGVGGLKAALDLQGLYGGPCRAPLATPGGEAIEDIKEGLASAGLL